MNQNDAPTGIGIGNIIIHAQDYANAVIHSRVENSPYSPFEDPTKTHCYGAYV